MCTVWQGNQLLYSALLCYSRFHRNLVRTENPHFYFKAALRDSASSQSHSPLNNPREISKPRTRLATLVHNWYSQGVCFKVCCRIQKCPKDLTNSCLDPVEKGGQVREKGLAWGISLGSGIPTTWKDFVFWRWRILIFAYFLALNALSFEILHFHEKCDKST